MLMISRTRVKTFVQFLFAGDTKSLHVRNEKETNSLRDELKTILNGWP